MASAVYWCRFANEFSKQMLINCRRIQTFFFLHKIRSVRIENRMHLFTQTYLSLSLAFFIVCAQSSNSICVLACSALHCPKINACGDPRETQKLFGKTRISICERNFCSVLYLFCVESHLLASAIAVVAFIAIAADTFPNGQSTVMQSVAGFFSMPFAISVNLSRCDSKSNTIYLRYLQISYSFGKYKLL